MPINRTIRQLVRERSLCLCEYCHSSEEGSTALFTFDHIIPQSLGGSDEPDNLALACTRCNSRRYNFMVGFDPKLNCNQPLFNPRKDLWSEHFIWNPEGDRIVAKTSIGRATLNRLDLNDDRHDDGSIQRSRRLWIRGGWHPPIGD